MAVEYQEIRTELEADGFRLDDEEYTEAVNYARRKAESSGKDESYMKDCLKSCQRVHKYIQKNPEEIEEWQIAGINAMFDQANKEGIVPYDLPYAIEGVLLILDPEVNK